jgi:hypothetical protein
MAGGLRVRDRQRGHLGGYRVRTSKDQKLGGQGKRGWETIGADRKTLVSLNEQDELATNRHRTQV